MIRPFVSILVFFVHLRSKGEIIVAMDPDLRDMYFCEVVRGD